MRHPFPAQLERFAARDLTVDEIHGIEEHLAVCAACASLARDRAHDSLAALRQELANTRRAPRWGWLAAAAAVLIAIFALWWMRPRPEPAPSPSPVIVKVEPKPAPPPPPAVSASTEERYANAEWDALVADARESGRLPLPRDLRDLRPPPDVIRGAARAVESLRPTAEVVGEARPSFAWPARKSATYTVFVFDGNREIARSGALRETTWTPARDLPRGRLLTWQVEAATGERIETIPRPPAPPAVFRIASEDDWREIARARDAHPHDHLLLGILYARAGMLGEAAGSLRRAAANDPDAQTLLDDLSRME